MENLWKKYPRETLTETQVIDKARLIPLIVATALFMEEEDERCEH